VAWGHVYVLRSEFDGDKSMRHDAVICVDEGKIGTWFRIRHLVSR
jgi:hypothetical protein